LEKKWMKNTVAFGRGMPPMLDHAQAGYRSMRQAAYYEMLQFAWLPRICAKIGRGERSPQFLTFKVVTTNASKFRQRLQEMKARFKETDATTQKLLQDLKEQIKTLESITFDA